MVSLEVSHDRVSLLPGQATHNGVFLFCTVEHEMKRVTFTEGFMFAGRSSSLSLYEITGLRSLKHLLWKGEEPRRTYHGCDILFRLRDSNDCFREIRYGPNSSVWVEHYGDAACQQRAMQHGTKSVAISGELLQIS